MLEMRRSKSDSSSLAELHSALSSSNGAGCVPDATKLFADGATTKTTKTDNQTIANLIFAAGVPSKDVGRVYLKLAGRVLPTDKHRAKAYIGRTLKHARIDEERWLLHDRAIPCDPLSALWDALALNQIRPGDGERQRTLRALLETGIALLSPHQRSLVRAWMARSGENNVVEIHAALPQFCGHGAYHCKNKAFARLTRIVAGLAAATGNLDLRPSGARKYSRHKQELRSRQKSTIAIFKKPGGARLVRREGEP